MNHHLTNDNEMLECAMRLHRNLVNHSTASDRIEWPTLVADAIDDDSAALLLTPLHEYCVNTDHDPAAADLMYAALRLMRNLDYEPVTWPIVINAIEMLIDMH